MTTHNRLEKIMTRTAVVAGVGPGLGAALVRKFVAEGCRVGMLARSPDYLAELEDELGARNALAIPTDITEDGAVTAAFAQVKDRFGPVDILVNHASLSNWKGLMDITPAEFERAWRVTVLGALHCCRVAAADMLTDKRGGSILFTGATSSIRGRQGAIDFSSAKFALRGLADSMARELWPQGVHVAHVLIDGIIDSATVRRQMNLAPDEPLLSPDDIARVYWSLIEQEPSAWSFELEVRPHTEEFYG
jgi:NAD(P)-dependent dehydrogenase (short-subunit alcohol dehydrogenase family)